MPLLPISLETTIVPPAAPPKSNNTVTGGRATPRSEDVPYQPERNARSRHRQPPPAQTWRPSRPAQPSTMRR